MYLEIANFDLMGLSDFDSFFINTSYLWWIFSDTGFEKKVHKALSNKKDFTISHYLKG